VRELKNKGKEKSCGFSHKKVALMVVNEEKKEMKNEMEFRVEYGA
jgi:hypothetical protein